MVNSGVLAMYYGGVVAFIKDARATSQGGEQQYRKGQELHITPAFLYMASTGALPINSYKIVLRQLNQMEDSEAIKLSEMVLPRDNMKPYIRRVIRVGQGKEQSIKIQVAVTQSIVINQHYDLAIEDQFDRMIPPMYLSSRAQADVFKWMLIKNFDVFNFFKAGKAASRKKWGKEGYETAKTLKGRYAGN